MDSGARKRSLHLSEIDDLAATVGNHAPCAGLPHVEDARHIGAHESLELLRRELFERSAVLHGRVANENADRSLGPLEITELRLRGRLVADVEGEDLRPGERGGRARKPARIRPFRTTSALALLGHCAGARPIPREEPVT